MPRILERITYLLHMDGKPSHARSWWVHAVLDSRDEAVSPMVAAFGELLVCVGDTCAKRSYVSQ